MPRALETAVEEMPKRRSGLPAQRSLGAIVAIGFTAVLVLLGFLVGLTIYEVDRTQRLRRALTDEVHPALIAIDDLRVSLFQVNEALRDHLMGLSPYGTGAYQHSSRMLARDLSRVLERRHSAEERRIVAALRDAVQRFQMQADGLVQQSNSPPAILNERYRTLVRGSLDEAADAARALHERKMAQVARLREGMSHGGDALTWYLLLGFGIGGVTCILLARHTVMLITQPLYHLMSAAGALERGEYDRVAAMAGPAGERPGGGTPVNELVRLRHSFARAAAVLRDRETRLVKGPSAATAWKSS
jgi:hypothetical protein